MSRFVRRLLSVAMVTVALIATAITTGVTPASAAAASKKGNCTPYIKSVLEGRDLFWVYWAGSSSGWSPSGSLRITATATVNGKDAGTVTGTETGTSVSTPVGGPYKAGPSLSASVKVTAYGPAGTVSCSAGVG